MQTPKSIKNWSWKHLVGTNICPWFVWTEKHTELFRNLREKDIKTNLMQMFWTSLILRVEICIFRNIAFILQETVIETHIDI